MPIPSPLRAPLYSASLDNWWKTSQSLVADDRAAVGVTAAVSTPMNSAGTFPARLSLNSFWNTSELSKQKNVDVQKRTVVDQPLALSDSSHQLILVSTTSFISPTSSDTAPAHHAPILRVSKSSERTTEDSKENTLPVTLQHEEQADGASRNGGGNAEQLESKAAAYQYESANEEVIETDEVCDCTGSLLPLSPGEGGGGRMNKEMSPEEDVVESVVCKYMRIVEEKRECEKQDSSQVRFSFSYCWHHFYVLLIPLNSFQ